MQNHKITQIFTRKKIHPKTKEPLMSDKEFEKRTMTAKRLLENVCRERVIGFRALNALVGRAER